jgi:hypothetical protein
MEPFALLLVAVSAPSDADSGSVTTDLPTALGGSPTPGSSTPATSTTNNFRSVDQQVDPMLVNVHRFPMSARLRAGDVLGIKGVTLSVGTGAQNSSVLLRDGRDLELDQYTRILLVPASVAGTKAQPSGQAQQTQPSVGADLPIARPAAVTTDEVAEEDVETCAPPACSMVSSTGESGLEGSEIANIPITTLGFAPRLQTEILEPDEDEVLAYLSPTELLVAFNPHGLIPRSTVAGTWSTVRVVRATVIDVATHKLVRSMDWRIQDRKQYLWRLARHRVLVHVGAELRIYGPGLKVEGRIPVTGAVAFVRASPDGKILAVGVIKERHTPELHAKLHESLEQEPDEDVEVMVLNEKFETIASSMSTSDMLPPTLLNEGQVKLLKQSAKGEQAEMRYRMQLRTWDNVSRTLARFSSGCVPQISSFAPDLVLLVTCDATNHARDYRVLGPDGKLILRGQSQLKELGHSAIGEEGEQEFVLRIFEADEPILPGEVFHPESLQSGRLGVYRAEDGKQLLSVRVHEPAASSGGYAIAPGGGQLAVLMRDRIALYTLPVN